MSFRWKSGRSLRTNRDFFTPSRHHTFRASCNFRFSWTQPQFFELSWQTGRYISFTNAVSMVVLTDAMFTDWCLSMERRRRTSTSVYVSSPLDDEWPKIPRTPREGGPFSWDNRQRQTCHLPPIGPFLINRIPFFVNSQALRPSKYSACAPGSHRQVEVVISRVYHFFVHRCLFGDMQVYR